MSQQIELLYESEVETLHLECTAEAVKLLEELGLTAQRELYNKKGNPELDFPFIPATNEQAFVYAMVFSTCYKLEEFKSEPIPLRVLEVLKKAKECGRFESFAIWTDEATLNSDPVLVAIEKVGQYKYNLYLLARWGSALKPYSQLKDAAFNLYKQKLEEIASEAASSLKDSLDKCAKNINPPVGINQSGSVSVRYPSFYRA